MSLALASGSATRAIRINARLDPTAARRLEFLIAKTGMAVSDVVRASLDSFYNATRQQSPAQTTSMDALIGKYRSDPKHKGQLSTNYKALYLEGLKKKHGVGTSAKASVTAA
jgi:hypothetical protein